VIEVRYLANEKLKTSRLGVIVSRRAAKRASARNRLKRLAREFFRLNNAQLKGHYEIVVRFLRAEDVELESSGVAETLRTLFKSAELI